jgi:hypothetical protein
MKVFLACYDQTAPLNDGTYWVWHHQELPRILLDQIYYDRVSSAWPEEPNTLAPTDLHGGLVSVDQKLVCVYRFLNGGYGKDGRPGRCVLVCAVTKRLELGGHEWLSILDCPVFQDLAQRVRDGADAVRPSELTLDWPTAPVNVDPDKQQQAGRLHGLKACDAEGVRDLTAIVATLAQGGHFHCRVLRRGAVWQAEVDHGVPTPPQPPPPDLPKQLTASKHRLFQRVWTFLSILAIPVVAALVISLGWLREKNAQLQEQLRAATAEINTLRQQKADLEKQLAGSGRSAR